MQHQSFALVGFRYSALICLTAWLSVCVSVFSKAGDTPTSSKQSTSNAVSLSGKERYYQVEIDLETGASHEGIGKALGQAIQTNVENYEELADSYISDLCSMLTTTDKETCYTQFIASTSDLMQNVPPPYQAEIDSMATALCSASEDKLDDNKLSLRELWLLNLLPSVARLTGCSGFGVFGERSETGRTVVGRNLDWFAGYTGQMYQLQAVIRIKNASESVTLIGYLGQVGCISGFNHAGVFGAIFDSPSGTSYNTEGKRCYSMDLRRALETNSEIDDVATHLSDSAKEYTFNHLIFLADRSNVKVLENNFDGTGTNMRRALRTSTSVLHDDASWSLPGAIAAVNSFMLQGNHNNFSNNQHNTARWHSLVQQSAEKGDFISRQEVKEIMGYDGEDDTPGSSDEGDLYHTWTQQSMVFVPVSGRLEVAFHPTSGSVADAPAYETVFSNQWLPTVNIALETTTVTEGNKSLKVMVELDQARPFDLEINLITKGSAVPGDDFAPLPETITVPADQTEASSNLNLYDDMVMENRESIVIALENSPNYMIAPSGTTSVEIVDDDTGDVVAPVPIDANSPMALAFEDFPERSIEMSEQPNIGLSMQNISNEPTMTWTTSDASVARVAPSGNVTPVTSGSVTIRAASVADSSLNVERRLSIMPPPEKREWQCTINALGITESTETIAFGMHPEAVDGTDEFDALKPDQSHESPAFHLEHSGNQYSTDIRTSKEYDEYRFIVETDKRQPAELNWLLTDLPDKTHCSLFEVSQDNIVINGSYRNMRQTNRLHVDADRSAKFVIRFGPQKSADIPIYTGWNLIALPFPLSQAKYWQTPLWDYQPVWQWLQDSNGQRHYQSVPKEASLHPSVGYWVYCEKPTPANLTLRGTLPSTPDITLSTGWNLTGVDRAVDLTGNQNTVIPSPVWEWNPNEEQYKMASRLLPGLGYWIYNHSDQSLQVNLSNLTKSPDFATVNGGTYTMGDTWDKGSDNEKPTHQVTVSSFLCSKYETTNDSVAAVFQWAYDNSLISADSDSIRNLHGDSRELLDLNSTSSQITFADEEIKPNAETRHHPCIEITWFGAAAYCNFLSLKDGLTPCYDLTDWSCDLLANGYRLPTEAEWEFAARGGNCDTDTGGDASQRYSGTDEHTVLDDVAWHSGNTDAEGNSGIESGKGTMEVGLKTANELGIFDLSGNVWEWCNDWYSDYTVDAIKNPKGPQEGTERVLRGGSWDSASGDAYVSNRYSDNALTSFNDFGFRVVRSIGVDRLQTYPVSFDSGENGMLKNPSLQTQDILHGTHTAVPDVTPTRGWRFIGWHPDPNKTITEPTDFTAEYEPVAIEASNLSARVSEQDLILSWSGNESATYAVYRSATETGTKTLLSEVNATTYTDETVVDGATYYYWVELLDGDNPDFDSTVSVTKSPYFEVDDDTIAFTTSDKLYLSDLNGNRRVIESVFQHPSHLFWSPDKSHLAFTAQYDNAGLADILSVIRHDGTNSKWLVDTSKDGMNDAMLSGNEPGEFFWSPQWSPAGNQLAYILYSGLDSTTGTNQLFAENLNFVETALSEQVNWINNEFFWFPDGNQILYNRIAFDDAGRLSAGEIRIASVSSGTNTLLRDSSDTTRIINQVALSPNGNKIAWAETDTAGTSNQNDDVIRLYVMDANGSEQTVKHVITETSDNGQIIEKLKFSSDATRLAYQTDAPYPYSDGGLFVIGVDGTNRIRLSPQVIDFYWSFDGSMIAAQSDENKLFVTDMATYESTELAFGSSFISYQWHPDRNSLIYGTDGIYLYDAMTEHTRLIQQVVDDHDIVHLIGSLDW